MLNSFARNPEDTEELAFSKKLLLVVALCCCFCGLFWGALYYYFLGIGTTMLLPWSFVLIVGMAIPIAHYLKNQFILVYALLICITWVTAFIQWNLGSIHDSAIVITWSFLGPIGALLFLNKKHAFLGMIQFLIIVIISVIIEPKWSDEALLVTDTFRHVFYLMNICAPTIVVFAAIIWYISEKDTAKEALNTRNNELEKKNNQIENQKLIIEDSLHEKEILLKEIHHRVKNNLQIVSGLMELQGRQANDTRIKEIMDQGQNRIRSMSLIHQLLYESEHLDKIDFKEYLDKLVQDISMMIRNESKQIDIKLDIPSFELNIDTAVPLGLIINELVMNSLKHAFGTINNGQIQISLKQEGDQFEIKVADDGKGLPSDFDLNNVSSLGLKLVRGLSRQIGGSCAFTDNNGTTVSIKFKNE